MDTQSFRTQLVEWMKEIVPYSQFDKYVRKTREGIETNPHNTDRHANHVNYIIYTKNHSYSISATPTYLGCIASTMFYRPGENWTRGNDLPDGKFNRSTWEYIKDAIVRYELEKIEQTVVGGVPDGPPCHSLPTPIETEYQEARHAAFLAQERLNRAERAMNGQDKKDPEMPSTRAAVEPEVDHDAFVAVVTHDFHVPEIVHHAPINKDGVIPLK
jgi:hypothetical protein